MKSSLHGCYILTMVLVGLVVPGAAFAEQNAPESPNEIVLNVDALPIALSEPTRQIAGMNFIGGAAFHPEKNDLFFTDVVRNGIYRLDQNGQVWRIFEETEGSNGIAFGPDGNLYVTRSRSGDVSFIDMKTGEVTVFVDSPRNGDSLNAPNDLVFDKTGGLYFTDPIFMPSGADEWLQGVYYRGTNGVVHKIIEDLQQPSGVGLSPDESVLYVLPFGEPVLMSYPIIAPGHVGPGRRLCELPHNGDGMAIDTFGNIYATQPDSQEVLVISPVGQIINRFKINDRPTNCTFGGRGNGTLFVTGKISIWTIPLNVAGHLPTAPDWPVIPGEHVDRVQYSAAEIFLRQLSPEQRERAQLPLDDPSRMDWSYLPGQRIGVSMSEMDSNQKLAMWQLVAGGLSPDGLELIHQIRVIENDVNEAGREDVGADDYWIAVYGDPDNGLDWGWRFEGHHISLNNFFDEGKRSSTTPMFLGAQPRSIESGIQRGVRPLGSINAKARAFVMNLDTDQRDMAIVDNATGDDIHTPMGAGDWVSTPKGIAGSALTPEERTALLEIVRMQVNHAPSSHADSLMNEYTKNVDDMHFAWFGGTGDGEPHAWMITGPDLHIEYHDAQEPHDHVHTVWRRPKNDFGGNPDDNGDKNIERQSRVTSGRE